MGRQNTNTYWENRYAAGGNSGKGSYGKFAQFKQEVLNALVEEFSIHSVVEFGCGDGSQLSHTEYPQYLGLDVAETAVTLCRERYNEDKTKSFEVYDSLETPSIPDAWKSDAALSLDVLYHLVEEEVFEKYLALLFGSAQQFVIVFSTNRKQGGLYTAPHVYHRVFTQLVEERYPEWELVRTIPHTMGRIRRFFGLAYPDFFVYRKRKN